MAWWLPKPNCWARKRGCQERREAPKEGEKGLALSPRGFSGIRKLPRKVSTSALLGRWHNPTWPSCPGGWVSPERYRPGARPGHRGKVPGAQQGSYPQGTAQTFPLTRPRSPGVGLLGEGSPGGQLGLQSGPAVSGVSRGPTKIPANPAVLGGSPRGQHGPHRPGSPGRGQKERQGPGGRIGGDAPKPSPFPDPRRTGDGG